MIANALNHVMTLGYSAQGNLLTTTDPLSHATSISYNLFGQPIAVTDPLGNTTTFEYDDQGNLISTTDPLGNRTMRLYDPVSRVIALTDPRGAVTTFAYDALNRVTTITDPRNGVTSFSYDHNGNLLTVTDAKGQVTTYTYDSMDRLVMRKDALGREEHYEYDPAGNLTQFTDRKHQVSTHQYDALNRRISSASADGSTVGYVYDAVGRLVRAEDSVVGRIDFVYDNLDRLMQEITPLGSITYQYDALGRRTTMTVSGQQPVSYGYDAASRLVQVQQGNLTVGLGYDAAGRRTSLTYPNGTNTTYSYDHASRVTDILHQGPAGVIENLVYSYDAAGHRISVTRSGGVATLLPAAVQAAYDVANEQITFNSLPQSFDANGNQTSDGASTYTYDARNRLVAITGPSLSASFVYDALGRRISKSISGQITQFLYDGNDIVAEIGGGAVGASYLRSLNIDEPFVRNSDGKEYYHTDALGSTLALSNPDAVTTVSYGYEAFGKTMITGVSSNPFQYTGRENDGTGLYYYRARYYSPHLQRFSREDPLRFRGGDINLYPYALDNPVNYFDLSGFSLAEDFFSGAGSYFKGIYGSFRFAGRLAGLYGECEQLRARLEDEFFWLVLRELLSDEDYDVGPLLDLAREYALDHKARLAGRFGTAALINYGLTQFGGGYGLALGVSLNALSIHGNVRSTIELGGRQLEDLVNAAIGGEEPPPGLNECCPR